MSHLSHNHLKKGSFELKVVNGWQYGQGFQKIDEMGAQQFYVDPFRVGNQCIRVNCCEELDCITNEVVKTYMCEKHHVFRTYTSQKDFDSDKSTKTWLNEFEINPEKYDFKHSVNRTLDNPDQISDVIMNETGKKGFKYTVKYDGNGQWECNCQHYHNHPGKCCKHINACVDYYCLEIAMVPREKNGKANPKWLPYTTRFALSGCLLNRAPVYTAFPGFTDIVWDLDNEKIRL